MKNKIIITEENWLEMTIDFLENYIIIIDGKEEYTTEIDRVEKLIKYLNKTN